MPNPWFHKIQAKIVVSFALMLIVLPASRVSAAPERPIIFVPGILGSILKQGDQILWGNAAALRRFAKLKIPNGPADPSDGVIATDLISEFQILGPWKVDQYNTIINRLLDNQYVLNKTLFLFPYDWRQSNITSAANLHKYVSANPVLRDHKFDIIAHSMGGLVSRLFINNSEYRSNVVNFVTLATPFYGSTNTILTLDSGWGTVPNWTAGGLETIRSTVLSFPSFYEMLPTYSLCCIRGLPGKKDRKPVDIMNATTWHELKWVSDNALPSDYSARVGQILERARSVRDIIRAPLPASINGIRFAGERNDTTGQFYYNPLNGKVVRWRYFNGDGTVIVSSASMDFQKPSYVSFMKHQTIFNSDLVLAQLERALGLCKNCKPINYAGEVPSLTTADGKVFEARRASVVVDPPVVSPTDTLVINVSAMAAASEPIEGVTVSGYIDVPGQPPELLSFEPSVITEDVDDATKVRVIRFEARTKAPDVGGPSSVRVRLSGLTTEIVDQFVVVPPT